MLLARNFTPRKCYRTRAGSGKAARDYHLDSSTGIAKETYRGSVNFALALGMHHAHAMNCWRTTDLYKCSSSEPHDSVADWNERRWL